MDVRKRGGDGGEQQEDGSLMVNILLERGESNETQPPQFSYLRAADTIGSVTDCEVSILASLGLLPPVTWRLICFCGSELLFWALSY